jgi:hypothetical protein
MANLLEARAVRRIHAKEQPGQLDATNRSLIE